MSCGRSGPSMDNRSRRVLGRSYAARKMAFPWGGVNSEIDRTRLARAINLEARPRDGECSCDCFDAQLHGDNCNHSLLVRLLGGDEEVVWALRKIVPKPKMRYLGVTPKRARPKMTHDQLVAIITTILAMKTGLQGGMTGPDDALKGWVETANTIVHAANGTRAPR